jgi:hypothetical protein
VHVHGASPNAGVFSSRLSISPCFWISRVTIPSKFIADWAVNEGAVGKGLAWPTSSLQRETERTQRQAQVPFRTLPTLFQPKIGGLKGLATAKGMDDARICVESAIEVALQRKETAMLRVELIAQGSDGSSH